MAPKRKKRRGEGSVYLRGRIWWYKFYHQGRKIERSSRSEDRAEAERQLAIARGQLAQGMTPSVRYDRVRFRDLVELIKTDYKVKKRKTIGKLERNIKLHLGPYFGFMKTSEITSDRISNYIEKRLDEDASHATINRELANLKRMFRLALQQTPSRVERVPYIPKLEEDNVREEFFTDQEYVDLLEELPEAIRPVVTFAYWYGWRKSEILGLTWDKVNLEEGTVRLVRGKSKNRSAREIELFPEVLGMLREMWNDKARIKTEYVFHRNGNEVKDFYGAWRRACEKIRVPGRWFHDLRRTAIRNMVRMGIPERVAMEISGHKTRSVFERYNIVDPKDMKMAARAQQARAEEVLATFSATIRESGEGGNVVELKKPE